MNRHTHIVVDLGFGDSGKGTIVDTLVRKHGAHTVFRFNGGAQAAHNVVTADGQHHTFEQFGSGTFVPGVQTVLSEFMLVQPWALFHEEAHLQTVGVTDAFDRLFIHERSLITTPFHRAANQLRERSRGDARHGSCGIGVGETAKDAVECDASLVLRVGDLRDREQFIAKMYRVRKYKYDQMRLLIAAQRKNPEAEENILTLEDPEEVMYWVHQLFDSIDKIHIIDDAFIKSVLSCDGHVVFEGAQGVLIDEWRGFHPYTTWSTCTFDNALEVLKRANYVGEVNRIGVVRAYATRHGAGPFVTEDAGLTERIPDTHNKTETWQQGFRIGWFDCVMTRYAIKACGGIDSLAMTCLDRLRNEPVWRVCADYELSKEDWDTELFDANSVSSRFVQDIRPGAFKDLAHQEQLTHALERARPICQITAVPGVFEEKVDIHIKLIQQKLGISVSILSFGPTAKDKKFL